MNVQQLREKLTQMVSQYDDPEEIFKTSVDEFIHLYGLRNDRSELIKYMLAIEYAPSLDEVPILIRELATPELVISEMECHLNLMSEAQLITFKEVA